MGFAILGNVNGHHEVVKSWQNIRQAFYEEGFEFQGSEQNHYGVDDQIYDKDFLENYLEKITKFYDDGSQNFSNHMKSIKSLESNNPIKLKFFTEFYKNESSGKELIYTSPTVFFSGKGMYSSPFEKISGTYIGEGIVKPGIPNEEYGTVDKMGKKIEDQGFKFLKAYEQMQTSPENNS